MKRSFLWLGLLLIGVGAAGWFGTGCATRPPLQLARQVDLSRYAGKWYEIARYPNWFQRACCGDTTAEYTPMGDGVLGVVNRCQTRNGTWKEVRGTARVVPGSNNAHLRVRFGGPWSGDYCILGVDEKDYRWAVVGHPSRNFLWLLAREPQAEPEMLEAMLRVAEAQGYSRQRLVQRQ